MGIDTINKRTYSSPKIARSYTHAVDLTEAERAIFDRLAEHITGSMVLDIGVGAGRTTAYLAPRANHYVGIDYSEQMVKICQQRFPDVPIRWADARDLSAFPDESFDFVLFSYNGLDYMGHDGRLAALREIRRVLAQGGWFVFSSHNLAYAASHRFWKRIFRVDFNYGIVNFVREVTQVPIRLFYFLHNRKHEQRQLSYWIVNDPGHDFRLMTYYIAPREQRSQLVDAGFNSEVITSDSSGKSAADDESGSVYLYYAVHA